MQIIRSIEGIASAIGWRRSNRQIGLVATMGNLHDGNMALVDLCRRESDIAVVSVYVNPLLFTDDDAFAAYPRNLEADAARLEAADVDYLLAPTDAEMFPGGTLDITRVKLPALAGELLGARAPGQFDARATVWLKLFNIVHPETAYFGEKNIQEIVLIKRLVTDLNLSLRISVVPTVRTSDQVAICSGIAQLTDTQLRTAPVLLQTLNDVGHALRNGARNYSKLEQTARVALRGAGFETEFVAIRENHNLRPPGDKTRAFRVLASAQLGLAHLVDNIEVALADEPVGPDKSTGADCTRAPGGTTPPAGTTADDA